MVVFPRDAAFKDGKCVAVGCPAALYNKKDGYTHATVWLPSDHYDFIGPLKVEGLTADEIREHAAQYLESRG